MVKAEAILLKSLNELLGTQKLNIDDIANPNLADIYKVSTKQSLSTIIYPVIKKYMDNIDINDSLLQLWKDNARNISFYNLLYLQQVNWLMQEFKKENIFPLLIKGLAISRFYEKPELRGMCDLDILISESEWGKVRDLLNKIGYSQFEEDDYNPLHIGYTKKGYITVEAHRNLIHTGFLGNRPKEEWYNNIWVRKKKIQYKEIELFVMSEEDELIGQITHFASHFIYIGTKLKHLFDIALIIKSNEKSLDWDYIIDTLEAIGFLKFGKLLFSACNTFFNINLPQSLIITEKRMVEQFTNDLLDRFSYEKVKDDFKGWLNIVGRLKLLSKIPFLLPVAWAIEIKAQYRIHGFKIPFLITNSIKNIKTINRKIKIIRKFDLIAYN